MGQDPVLPQWMALTCLRSEDSIRRAFAHVDEDAATLWLDMHLNQTYAPLLATAWILDLDATVKPLYGEQQGARLGYNPHKPGWPSLVYEAVLCAAAKLVLNVDVQVGNQTASEYAQPVLWGWLNARERESWASLLRGDLAHGSEKMMKEAEARNPPYLFKLKHSQRGLKMVAELGARVVDWQDAGGHWKGIKSAASGCKAGAKTRKANATSMRYW